MLHAMYRDTVYSKDYQARGAAGLHTSRRRKLSCERDRTLSCARLDGWWIISPIRRPFTWTTSRFSSWMRCVRVASLGNIFSRKHPKIKSKSETNEMWDSVCICVCVCFACFLFSASCPTSASLFADHEPRCLCCFIWRCPKLRHDELASMFICCYLSSMTSRHRTVF